MDTLRMLFETRHMGERQFEIEELDGWRFGSTPALGQTWAEGHPAPGQLANSAQLSEAASAVRERLDDHLGVVRDLGCSRLDSTATHGFAKPQEARAFLAGMAAIQLPRCETSRRGNPVHSIFWTHAKGRKKLARCYDKGLERGGEAFKFARLEDQRRFSGGRPPVEVVTEDGYARSRFEARFGPIRKAVKGVKAAAFPIIAQAIADEALFGYRDVLEAERLAGSLVLLRAGAGDAYRRSTFYSRRAELLENGWIAVDDEAEAVEVDLGEVIESTLDSEAWRA